MHHSRLQTCHITKPKCCYKPTFKSLLILQGRRLSLNSTALWKITFYKTMFMDKTSLYVGAFRSINIKCVKRTILNPWGQLNVQQRANDKARGSGDANLFLNTPYLGHLGLHPGGFERWHSLLCCSWTVKIHKAVAWREKRREGERVQRKKKTGISKEKMKADD